MFWCGFLRSKAICNFCEKRGFILSLNTLRFLVLSAGAALLAGCVSSPIPVSENFPVTVQPKVRSAGHWHLLAKDVVSQTTTSLDKVVTPATDLYVSLPANPTAFDKAFREFLITELVKSNRVVRQSPDKTTEISYQTQVVRHNSPRPHFVPLGFTVVTAGLYAAYSLGTAPYGDKLAGGLALAGVADAVSSMNSGGPTHTELILTTTISSGGRYLVRKTDVYYIEEPDVMLMQYVAPQNMKVVGP